MTIVAAVKSRDGLVIGTDSMTQVTRVDPSNPQLAVPHASRLTN
jgi:hypothetical protein